MSRSLLLLAFVSAATAAPKLLLSDADGTSCSMKKYGDNVDSSCDVSTATSSIDANAADIDRLQSAQLALKTEQGKIRAELDKQMERFDAFARVEAANNAALRMLITELTVRVAINEQNHKEDVSALMDAKRAFEAADNKLQQAVDTVSKMPGPKGEKGDTGARGRDGRMGLDGAKGDTGARGATGAKGDTPVSCTPVDCHNRGVAEGWRHEGCACTCQKGYSGAACETDIDECAPNPCKNGGTCSEHGVGDYRCTKCNAGFMGRNCEVDINECASSPCKNGGRCIDKVNAYECECSSAWRGAQCEISNCNPHQISLTGCSSSSTYSGGYRCNNALGGNGGDFATRWQRVGGWIRVNMPSGRWRITSINIRFRSANVDHTSATRISGDHSGSEMIGGDYHASGDWGVNSPLIADNWLQVTAAGVQRGGYNWGAKNIYVYGCRIDD